MKQFYLGVAAIVTLVPLAIYGQGVCPVRTLKVQVLEGYVLDAGRNATPITDTKLEVRRSDDESVVKTVTSDAKGFFTFSNLTKGTYRLSTYFLVNGNEIAPKFDIVVKVTKTRAERDPNQLEIRLGPSCFESSARTKRDPPTANGRE